jgi:hypothetical protein
MKLSNISKPAWHRNGVCGEFFEVITFDMAEDSQPRKMVAIRFPDDDNKDDFNAPRIAVLDIAMLAQGIIEMGEGNAWRGDRFSDELDSYFTINKKEVTA